uniref:Tigger transposable element-derived protein 4 n=1 Tax=Bactrocera latifrons TaxID=174628 RepID=A0A0K8WF86_BACLA
MWLCGHYEYNKKAWMTSEIYDKWLKNLDKVFVAQNRKILLFIDNCPTHSKNLQANLKNIKLQYFPSNLMSVLQPMDQGIIQNLKQHYRKRIVMKVLAHMEEPTPTTVSLPDAIRDLNKTWNLGVKPQPISNCFRKAGFAKGELMQNTTTDDWDEEDDLPLSELKQIWTTIERQWEAIMCLLMITSILTMVCKQWDSEQMTTFKIASWKI